jgi:presenilin-like A22 family membrane protease
MVKMAKYQTDAKVFAGIMLPYKMPKPAKPIKKKSARSVKAAKTVEVKVKTAILGGGDVAFPLLFAGAVMKTAGSIIPAYIIVGTTTIALFLLLYFAEKDKFYPAMPFISAGCFLGWAITLIF